MSAEHQRLLKQLEEQVQTCQYLEANTLIESLSPSHYYDAEYGKASKQYTHFLGLSVSVFYFCGRWERCLRVVEELLALYREFGDKVVLDSTVLWSRYYKAMIEYARGARESLVQIFEELEELALSEDEKDLAILALSRRAALYSGTGNLERAEKTMREASELLESCDNARTKAYYFIGFGVLAYRQNDLVAGQLYVDKGFEVLEEQHSPELGQLCRFQAILLSSQGKHQEALSFLTRAFHIFQLIGFAYGKAKVWESLGRTTTALNALEQACFCLEQFLALSRKLGSKADMALAYGKLGELWMLREDYKLAIYYFKRDLAISEGTGSYFALAYVYRNLGRAYLGTEEFEKCLANLRESLALFQYVEDNKNVARVKMDLCEVHLALENPRQAEIECRKSKELFQELDCNLELAYLLVLEAEILELVGQYDLAEQKVLSAIEELENSRHALWLGHAWEVLGDTYFATKRPEEAWEAVYKAFRLALESGLEHLAYRYLAKLSKIDETKALSVIVDPLLG